MSVGPKEIPAKSVAPRQPRNITGQHEAAPGKVATPQADTPSKAGKQERKAEFGQATYYRQGVLVPGGPHKSTVPRRSR
jgi:hypothetical protein